MAFLNPRLDAYGAKEFGLVSAVFDDDDFDAEVDALASRLAAGPTASFAAAKRLFNEASLGERLDDHLDREREALMRAADSPEFAARLESFFSRRPVGH